MKDIRGAHVAAVRNAIFKTVGLTQLSSTRRKNSKDVMVWKSSKEVKAEYNNLYKDETLIENITAAAFPSDRKSTRLNSSHLVISYAVFCLKKKKKIIVYLILTWLNLTTSISNTYPCPIL